MPFGCLCAARLPRGGRAADTAPDSRGEEGNGGGHREGEQPSPAATPCAHIGRGNRSMRARRKSQQNALFPQHITSPSDHSAPGKWPFPGGRMITFGGENNHSRSRTTAEGVQNLPFSPLPHISCQPERQSCRGQRAWALACMTAQASPSVLKTPTEVTTLFAKYRTFNKHGTLKKGRILQF